MDIQAFGVEEWMNAYEMRAKYNIAETCVESFTLKELLSLSMDEEEFLRGLLDMKLTYGYIEGSPEFRENVAKLYQNMEAENILATHGAIGANFLVLYSLVNAGDRVISVHPTYQQLYSIPQSFGAEVKLLKLRPENKFLPDLDELKSLVNDKTKIICINNPNNPSGALMTKEMLEEIVEIARICDAYILCDEVYRGLHQDDQTTIPSIVDLYEKGVSTGSMSKVYSLAGIRMGWIASSKEVITECFKHRDYNTISCGMLDDKLAVQALKNRDKIMKRNLTIIKENLAILDQWIQKEPRISYIKPQGGTTALLKYDFDMPSEKFCKELLNRTGAFLVPGKCFDMEGWLRIGYACHAHMLKKGLEKVSEYMRALE